MPGLHEGGNDRSGKQIEQKQRVKKKCKRDAIFIGSEVVWTVQYHV